MKFKNLESLTLMSLLLLSNGVFAKGDKSPNLEVKDEVSLSDSATKREGKVRAPILSDAEIDKKLNEFSEKATTERIKKLEEFKQIQATNSEKIYANKIAANQDMAKMYQEAKPTTAAEKRELFKKLMSEREKMRSYEKTLNEETRAAREKLLGEGYGGKKWKPFKEGDESKRKY